MNPSITLATLTVPFVGLQPQAPQGRELLEALGAVWQLTAQVQRSEAQPVAGQLQQQVRRQLALAVQLQLLEGRERFEVKDLLPCCTTWKAATRRLPHLHRGNELTSSGSKHQGKSVGAGASKCRASSRG